MTRTNTQIPQKSSQTSAVPPDLDAETSGGVKPNVSQDVERFVDTVRRIAKETGVSERTARRYLGRGELPPGRDKRRLGMDGKLYPGTKPNSTYWTPLRGPLTIARSNIRRAAKERYFYDDDLARLREIASEANALLAHWEECHEQLNGN